MMSTTAFSNYPYNMHSMGYHSPIEAGVTSKLSSYQINSLAAGGFAPTSSPMDIMQQAINPYGQAGNGSYHNGETVLYFIGLKQPAVRHLGPPHNLGLRHSLRHGRLHWACLNGDFRD